MLNQEKIGKFIAERRKLQGMTQKQLAEKLGVSDKAVSKWETGRSMPDNVILLELCDSLGINVNELLSGEMLAADSYHGKAEENMVNLIEQSEQERKKGRGTLFTTSAGEILLITALIGVMLTSQGRLEYYFDIVTLFGIVIIMGIVLFASGLGKAFLTSFSLAFGKGKEHSQEQVSQAVAAHKLVLITVLAAGIILTLASMISICVNVVDITWQVIGANLSVALLSVLYSLVFDLLLLPVTGRLWAMYKR